jgi:hypothetical protein
MKTRPGWKDNIRMDLREIGWKVVRWMNMAQDRDHWWTLVITVMNLRIPYKAGDFFY